MKLQHYAETDSLSIELRAGPGVETREIAKGVVADRDAEEGVMRLDIDEASRRVDLATRETVALPVAQTKAA